MEASRFAKSFWQGRFLSATTRACRLGAPPGTPSGREDPDRHSQHAQRSGPPHPARQTVSAPDGEELRPALWRRTQGSRTGGRAIKFIAGGSAHPPSPTIAVLPPPPPARPPPGAVWL